jgi:hypothetical protein
VDFSHCYFFWRFSRTLALWLATLTIIEIMDTEKLTKAQRMADAQMKRGKRKAMSIVYLVVGGLWIVWRIVRLSSETDQSVILPTIIVFLFVWLLLRWLTKPDPLHRADHITVTTEPVYFSDILRSFWRKIFHGAKWRSNDEPNEIL